jgi:SAM-dependent methyltransferase
MSDRELPYDNYRNSHLHKGQEYHDKFVNNSYRSIIWNIEQRLLLDIIERHRQRRQKPIRLLDFACGTGRILEVLENRLAESTGVDISDSMLAVARKHLSRSRLLHMDITRSGGLDGEIFDVISAFRFFPNAEPDLRRETMAQLAQLLEQDGILIANNHLRCGGSKLRLRTWLARLGVKQVQRKLHCMSDCEMLQLASANGLELHEQHFTAVMPIFKESRPLLTRFLLRWIEENVVDRAPITPYANSTIYVFGRRQTLGSKQTRPYATHGIHDRQ